MSESATENTTKPNTHRLGIMLSHKIQLKRFSISIIYALAITFFLLYLVAAFANWKIFADITLAVAGSLGAAAIFSSIISASEKVEKQDQLQKLEIIESQITNGNLSIINIISKMNLDKNDTFIRIHQTSTPLSEIEKVIDKNKGSLYFSAMGITLYPLQRIIERICAIKNANVDIILPDPSSSEFKNICEFEGRSVENTAARAQSMAKIFQNATGTKKQFRKSRRASQITVVRIGDTIFWRPRLIIDHDNEQPFCFEVNEVMSPRIFRLLKRELGSQWDEGESVK
jgi:hypothetical protein